MKNKIINLMKIFVMVVCLASLTACSTVDSVDINTVLNNQSAVAIEDVVFVSRADNIELGDIQPGEKVEKSLTFYNEEGVNIKYSLNGQRFDFRISTDFEKEYKNAKTVNITYGPDKNGIETFKTEIQQNFNILPVLIPVATAVVILALVVVLLKLKKAKKNN